MSCIYISLGMTLGGFLLLSVYDDLEGHLRTVYSDNSMWAIIWNSSKLGCFFPDRYKFLKKSHIKVKRSRRSFLRELLQPIVVGLISRHGSTLWNGPLVITDCKNPRSSWSDIVKRVKSCDKSMAAEGSHLQGGDKQLLTDELGTSFMVLIQFSLDIHGNLFQVPIDTKIWGCTSPLNKMG